MAELRLPIYTDASLEVGKQYNTIVVDSGYYPVGEEFDLVNETNQVRATGVITEIKDTNFDLLGSSDLHNMASLNMQSWPNAANYFLTRFGEYFTYAGPVQLVTFEVKSTLNFDTILIESVQDEKELGLPYSSDEEDNEPSPVSYEVVEHEETS